MSTQDVELMRALSRQIFERTKTDPAFKDQIQQDPDTTLASAGLPQVAIGDFLRDAKIGDVSGYVVACSLTCMLTLSY